MKFQFNKRDTTIAVYAFLVLAAAILFSGFLNHFQSVSKVFSVLLGLLMPFIYAFGIAYILNPILKFFERMVVRPLLGKWTSGRLIRWLAILLTYLFSTGMIAIFVRIVIPQLVFSISGLVYRLTSFLNSTDTWLPRLVSLFPNIDLNATIASALRQYADTLITTMISMFRQLLPWLLSFSTRLASGLLAIVVGIVISVYMLVDKEHFCAGIKKMWYAFLPKNRTDWLLDLTAEANRVFSGFIGGKILDSVIIGILCFFGMSLLRMPNVMLNSVIVGVTNVIPYFGPFIGAISSFFIILIDAPIKALWFLVFILILQQFDGSILGPKILGDSTGLSAFWVIFSIMLFGGLYGFIGMFLGVPVFSVIFMLLRRLINARLDQRGMPMETACYCAPEMPMPSGSVKKDGAAPRKRGSYVSRIKIPHIKRTEEPSSAPDGTAEPPEDSKNE